MYFVIMLIFIGYILPGFVVVVLFSEEMSVCHSSRFGTYNVNQGGLSASQVL